jgi:hypothetical protein
LQLLWLMYMSLTFQSSQLITELLKQVNKADAQVKEPVKAFFNALKEDQAEDCLWVILLRSFTVCFGCRSCHMVVHQKNDKTGDRSIDQYWIICTDRCDGYQQ